MLERQRRERAARPTGPGLDRLKQSASGLMSAKVSSGSLRKTCFIISCRFPHAFVALRTFCQCAFSSGLRYRSSTQLVELMMVNGGFPLHFSFAMSYMRKKDTERAQRVA